jgi:hypothetical protein
MATLLIVIAAPLALLGFALATRESDGSRVDPPLAHGPVQMADGLADAPRMLGNPHRYADRDARR